MSENSRDFVGSEFEKFKKIADTLSDEELYKLNIRDAYTEDMRPVLHWLSGFGYSDYEAVDGSQMEANKKIEYLLKRGYDVDKTDKDGYTALAHAIQVGNYTTAILLLQNKANPFSKSPWEGYDTVYDFMFDKDGNYRDRTYRNHSTERQDKTPESIRDTEILEDRLQKIRALCKPQFEGQKISCSNIDEYQDATYKKLKNCSRDYSECYIKLFHGHLQDIIMVPVTKLKKIGEIRDRGKRKKAKDKMLEEFLGEKDWLNEIIKREPSSEEILKQLTAMDFGNEEEISKAEWKTLKENDSRLLSYAEKMVNTIRSDIPKDPLEEKAAYFKKEQQEELSDRLLDRRCYRLPPYTPEEINQKVIPKIRYEIYKRYHGEHR